MGCYGKTLFFSLGDCASKSKSVSNLSFSSLSESIKDTQMSVNQSAQTSTVTVQNQRIVLNKFPAGTANIKISQGMKLKIASKTQMSSTIKKADMDELAASIQSQLDNTLDVKSDIGVDQSIQEKITNVKKSIISVVKKNTTITSSNKAAAEAVAVNNQEIVIDFAEFNSDMLEAIVARFKVPGSTGAIPEIIINQDLIADIQMESALSAVAEAISQDKQVNKAETALKEALVAKGMGLGELTAGAVKELGKVVDTAGKLGDTALKEGGSVLRTYVMIIGAVIVAAIIGFVVFGKSLVSNPDAIKAIGSTASSMSSAGRMTGAASAIPSAPGLPKASFGFGSCGYRF
jgi:hypothetical protein